MKHEPIPGPDEDPTHDPIEAIVREYTAKFLDDVDKLGLCNTCAISELAAYTMATQLIAVNCVAPNSAGKPVMVPERVAVSVEEVSNRALEVLQEFLDDTHERDKRGLN
jgi:hypothetical protein